MWVPRRPFVGLRWRNDTQAANKQPITRAVVLPSLHGLLSLHSLRCSVSRRHLNHGVFHVSSVFAVALAVEVRYSTKRVAFVCLSIPPSQSSEHAYPDRGNPIECRSYLLVVNRWGARVIRWALTETKPSKVATAARHHLPSSHPTSSYGIFFGAK